MTRAFHNPYVREGQWQRMFDRRLPAVVPMSVPVMARSDGSDVSHGRGAGAEPAPLPQTQSLSISRRSNLTRKTPYMHMTFHPLERRLDTAIWRALFASSTKQARQFVTHGGVRVNGKKMLYPGYLLNPGDMFAVRPDLVMFATGQPKARKGAPHSARDVMENQANTEEDFLAEEEETQIEEENEAETEEDPKKTLERLMRTAKGLQTTGKSTLSAKQLRALRRLSRDVRSTISKLRGISSDEVDTTIEGLSNSLADIKAKLASKSELSDNPETSTATSTTSDSDTNDIEMLHAALTHARAVDPSRPYATPWRPRDYMSAFAFIPRYLEVNQNVCAAVYLRHPVARPGMSEVGSPFSTETMELAFNWYLRRR